MPSDKCLYSMGHPKIKCWNFKKKNHQPKFKNAQVKTGLIKPKSNFNYTVATQGDK